MVIIWACTFRSFFHNLTKIASLSISISSTVTTGEDLERYWGILDDFLPKVTSKDETPVVEWTDVL